MRTLINRNSTRTYRSFKPLKLLKWLLYAVLFVIIAAVVIFFSFRRYIHYSADGLHMEVPWLGYGVEDSANND